MRRRARHPGMGPIVIRLLAIVALGACAGRVTPAGAGIEGQVLAGPQCPVETVSSPCPPAPWIGTVRATAEDGTVYEDETDEEGRYAISLPPGTYEVVALAGGDGGPTFGEPQTVPVAEGQPLHLDLSVDTGIR